ncbi:MAG: hypothetical protein JO121_17520 [Deltaproteobacteria bacterium]|nr:hypothetical protein [Deltaproteobacteria bacterium]
MLVKRIKKEDRSRGGIIIPDTAKKNHQRARLWRSAGAFVQREWKGRAEARPSSKGL